tara:strand:+ start:127 stop:369 length:243 start_codon:yes stop_codon:yes gene_type:complete
MSWYILALVTLLETNKPDIKINMSVKFSAKETCEKFLYTYKDIFKIQLVELFPNIKVREIMCIDSKSAKEIQKQLYGTKI